MDTSSARRLKLDELSVTNTQKQSQCHDITAVSYTVFISDSANCLDYCDVYLTHDSTSVRKDHNSGRAHISNVRDWYAKYLPEGPSFPQFPPFAGGKRYQYSYRYIY